MAKSIKKDEIITYTPEALKNFRTIMYEWIDNLNFTLSPSECLEDPKPYLDVVRSRLLEIGWDGDGSINLMWIPPFMFTGKRTPEFTKGIIVWHVKQKSDGISWILSPEELPCETEFIQKGSDEK